jgi:hypothetical protein
MRWTISLRQQSNCGTGAVSQRIGDSLRKEAKTFVAIQVTGEQAPSIECSPKRGEWRQSCSKINVYRP